MQNPTNTILVVDNSIGFTGALKCALLQAQLMKDRYRYVFVLPNNSAVTDLVRAQGFVVETLPMREVQKKASSLILYVPLLIINTYRLKRIIANEGASILIMNDFYNLLGVTVKWLGASIKLITYVRFLPSAVPALLRKIWIGAAMRWADGIVAVSEAVRKQLPEHTKIIRIYDAVALVEKHPCKVLRDEGAPIKLLYLGNYIPGKGHNYALEAFIKAYAVNSKLRLTFAGGDMGLQKNKQFKLSLQKRVAALGLQHVVTFLPFVADVEALIKEADIVLNFSEAESFSMTTVEACFYGTPVIATRCGGPEEIIEHGRTGVLVANRNVEEMAQAIANLSVSKDLLNQFSMEARRLVREKFSKENFVQCLTGQLHQLISCE